MHNQAQLVVCERLCACTYAITWVAGWIYTFFLFSPLSHFLRYAARASVRMVLLLLLLLLNSLLSKSLSICRFFFLLLLFLPKISFFLNTHSRYLYRRGRRPSKSSKLKQKDSLCLVAMKVAAEAHVKICSCFALLTPYWLHSFLHLTLLLG